MLNDYFMKYVKKPDIKETEMEQKMNDLKKVKPRKIESGSIPEFDKHFKNIKAYPITPRMKVFDSYRIDMFKAIKTVENPFEKTFGFKFDKPEFGRLSNYYRYNVKNLGSKLDIALDQEAIRSGDINPDETPLGRTFSKNGIDEFMELYKKSRIEKLNNLGILADKEFNPSLKKDIIARKRGVNTIPVNSAKQNVVKSQGNVGGGEFKGEEGGDEDFAEGEYDVDAEVVESNKKIKRLKEEKGFNSLCAIIPKLCNFSILLFLYISINSVTPLL